MTLSTRVDEHFVLSTLAFGRYYDYYVYVGTLLDPSEKDWSEYLDYVAKSRGPNGTVTRTLVYSRGGIPSATQRKKLNELTAGLVMKVAVLTDSSLACGVVRVLNWMSGGYRAFAPEQLNAALQFLEASEKDAPHIGATMRVLERRLST